MYFTKFNHRIFFLHLLFWVVYCISNAYLWQTFDSTYNETTFYGLTRLPIKMIAVYINFYLLIQFFFQKRYFAFFSFFLLILLAQVLVQTYISALGVFNYQGFTQYSLLIFSVVILSSVLIIIHQFFIK